MDDELRLHYQYLLAFPNLGACSRIHAIGKLISTAQSKLGKKLQCGGTRFPIISLNRNSEYLAVPPSLQHDRRTTTGQPAFRAKYETRVKFRNKINIQIPPERFITEPTCTILEFTKIKREKQD